MYKRQVQTAEHLLGALFAEQIDDALITIDGPEPPILDGLSLIHISEPTRPY